ncbi:uncharacterized protein [Rutidosis leptorrhynchoides]|uniref:uncharacterized protein n=1 Tax=Rutidosis leptorrhynchoides TaxID=125765 RepID=UPI003A9980DD
MTWVPQTQNPEPPQTQEPEPTQNPEPIQTPTPNPEPTPDHEPTETISPNHEITETSSNNEPQPHEEQNDTNSDETTQRYVLPQRINRGVPPKRYSPEKEAQRSRYPMANIAQGNLSKEAQKFNSAIYSENIPTSVEQAFKSKDWKKAIEVEMKALNDNDTWEKCVIPQGKKPVGCRWVFTIKYKPDGTIERYKARLVAKGYTQTYGIDYSETFSPVAKIDTIRVHHTEAVMRIIRYLKKTVGNGVVFKKNGHLEAQVYTDASWAGEKGDRRSTSGFFTIVGGNLVAWKSKKQKVVSLSSAESEFRGIAKGVVEALWIRKLLIEIGFPPKEAIRILCDNEAAIAISENPVQHDRTKHVEVDRHFIREKLDAEIISLPHIRSEDQLADILTKLANGSLFSEVLGKLNIGNPTIQLEGEC